MFDFLLRMGICLIIYSIGFYFVYKNAYREGKTEGRTEGLLDGYRMSQKRFANQLSDISVTVTHRHVYDEDEDKDKADTPATPRSN